MVKILVMMKRKSGLTPEERFANHQAGIKSASVVKRYGIPVEIYQDQHSALKRNDEHWSLQEQLRGQQDPTQVGRALQSLSVRTIYALSPQAKGRIERLFGTFQDRLIAEMQLAGITDMSQANAFLDNPFLDDFNRQFARAPSQTKKSWRPRPRGLDLDRICSLRYEATVGNDNALRLGGILIDIPPGPRRASYAKARVEVSQLLDGSLKRPGNRGVPIQKIAAVLGHTDLKSTKR